MVLDVGGCLPLGVTKPLNPRGCYSPTLNTIVAEYCTIKAQNISKVENFQFVFKIDLLENYGLQKQTENKRSQLRVQFPKVYKSHVLKIVKLEKKRKRNKNLLNRVINGKTAAARAFFRVPVLNMRYTIMEYSLEEETYFSLQSTQKYSSFFLRRFPLNFSNLSQLSFFSQPLV